LSSRFWNQRLAARAWIFEAGALAVIDVLAASSRAIEADDGELAGPDA